MPVISLANAMAAISLKAMMVESLCRGPRDQSLTFSVLVYISCLYFSST